MDLQEKRAESEVKQEPVLIVSQVIDSCPTVYVVCKTNDFDTRKAQAGRFRLHRYFPIGLGTPNCRWELSVDKSGSLEDCLDYLHDKLSPYNKRVEQANWHELDKNPLCGLLE